MPAVGIETVVVEFGLGLVTRDDQTNQTDFVGFVDIVG